MKEEGQWPLKSTVDKLSKLFLFPCLFVLGHGLLPSLWHIFAWSSSRWNRRNLYVLPGSNGSSRYQPAPNCNICLCSLELSLNSFALETSYIDYELSLLKCRSVQLYLKKPCFKIYSVCFVNGYIGTGLLFFAGFSVNCGTVMHLSRNIQLLQVLNENNLMLLSS